MKRKNFLKTIGIIGASVPLFSMKNLIDEPTNDDLIPKSNCDVVPEETEGPYPLPFGVSTSSLVRTDLTEGSQDGIPLAITLKIVNAENDCAALSGLRVDIWHCNNRGYYSAYDGQPGIDGTVNNAGTTWLRGIQFTDSNGEVSFATIYPGWYTPRATHLHIQIYDAGENLLSTTQLAFPDATNSTVNAFYATSGTNSFTNSDDMVFADSFAEELMTVSGDTSNGYTAYKEISINAGASTGLHEIDKETGGQFSRLSCFPNPCTDHTTLTFKLIQKSECKITLFDETGKQILAIDLGELPSGIIEHVLETNHLDSGIYKYTLQVSTVAGVYHQTKQFVKN